MALAQRKKSDGHVHFADRHQEDLPSQAILKTDLIKVIQQEFDLTLDLNWLNKELDLSDNDHIEFSELKNMLTGR